MRKTCLMLLSAFMLIMLFSACADKKSTTPDAALPLSDSENHMIRSVIDNLLFENFPVIGIGTIADNHISIGLNRSDEEMGDLVDEVLSFISDTIAMHPDLSGMRIDMRVFHFEGTGPTVRIPVTDNESGSVVYPALPEAKPVTLEYATEVFDTWWVSGASCTTQVKKSSHKSVSAIRTQGTSTISFTQTFLNRSSFSFLN